MSEAALYDEVHVLAHRRSGRCRLTGSELGAGLVAAAFAELRRRGRLDRDDETSAVVVRDEQPTGLDIADAVLHEVVRGEARPAHLWIDLLHGPIGAQVRASRPADETGYRRAVRDRIVRAVAAPGDAGPDLDLGKVLWAVELTGSVLRWSPVTRFYLGRVASQDWVSRSVREWMGLSVRLSRPLTI